MAHTDTDRRMPADAADWIRQLLQDDAQRLPGYLRLEVDGIESMLGLKPRARVLDLGCGSGRQTVELARRGYRVVGMDVSPAALAGTRAAVRGQTLNVHFVAGDMRRIPYSGEFNAVINLQHPVGCFPAERDDLACLASAHRALKAGGKLMLDLVNREWLICQLGFQAPHAGSALDLRTGRLNCRGLIPSAHSRPAVLGDSLRIYSLTEIQALLQRAGFAFRKVFGDFEGNAYGFSSLRMIVLAEKAAAPPERGRGADGLPLALRIKGRPR